MIGRDDLAACQVSYDQSRLPGVNDDIGPGVDYGNLWLANRLYFRVILFMGGVSTEFPVEGIGIISEFGSMFCALERWK